MLCCQSNPQQDIKIISPSKKYYLTTTINSSNESKDDYADVVIHLYSSSGQLKYSLNTHAGDFSKWAVGWDKQNDTIILFSSDIGIYAWKIETDSLEEVEARNSIEHNYIEQTAKDIKAKKYFDQ